jgi:hypothetical protein
MARIIITQTELEKMVEKALENACAYHAIGNYKLMYQYRGIAEAYLDLLEDFGIYYDDVTINEHVQDMRDILAEESRKLKVERI